MEKLDFFLMTVAESSPVALQRVGDNNAFPGCEEYAIDKLLLIPGFDLGDFMEHDAVSVAEEVFVAPVSLPGSALEEAHAVWRVALKSGPVALMRVRVTGDKAGSQVVIQGRGQVIEDLTLEPYLQLSMVEAARHDAFEELNKIALATAGLLKGVASLFTDPDQQQTATATLGEALSLTD